MKAKPARRAILVGPLATDRAWLRAAFARLRVTKRDLLVGVDRGAELLIRYGIEPDLAIGDWDSIRTPGLISKRVHLTLPRDKDRSDFCYALQAAVKARVSEVLCFGLTGGRPDHHLAVMLDLSGLAGTQGQGVKSVSAYGPEGEYHFLSKHRRKWSARLPRGQLLSVFALGSPVRGLTLRGLEYGLEDAVLKPSSHGLSNVVARPVVEVRLKSGKLLVIIPSGMHE
jgi:thiamine pyrophosphokinase